MSKNASRVGLFVLAIAMMAVSLYMTFHYFEVKYPTGMKSSSLCDINQFFSCDKSISSALSNVLDIPISIFGFAMGLFLFIGMISKNEKYIETLSTVLLLNFLGCLGLFVYSLTALNGLCPFCTGYYILSALAFFIYRSEARSFKFDLKSLGMMAVATIVLASGTKIYADSRSAQPAESGSDGSNAAEAAAMRHFELLPRVQFAMESEFKVTDHPNAPIKMKVFSDFQCPACRALSETIVQLKERYQDKLDIEYFFYPLDMSCNPGMTRPMHPFACKAAYVAVCSGKDFSKVHDELFQNQERFSDAWLDGLANKLKISACVKQKETKDKVISYIGAALPVGIGATPTFLVNGTKFEGGFPTEQLSLVFDGILKKQSETK